jgi:hypothetical protein
MFSGSYDPADVTFLLKPVSLAPTSVADKEAAIQSGRRHYSEMLSPETPPDEAYLALYRMALARNGARLAQDIVNLAAALDRQSADRPEIVLASLARAGTPIGILLARALRRRRRKVAHYSISIIRDRGIDTQALAHIAARHNPADTVFVDGWTGKGAIAGELHVSLAGTGFTPTLVVVADPAGRADLAATDDDYLIASGLLNGIVSGLVSRSILNTDVVGPGDFHACVYFGEHEPHDLSRAFVAEIDALACCLAPQPIIGEPMRQRALAAECDALVASLMAMSGTTDRNRVKPGIAESTRALLRRLPEQLFVRDFDDPDVAHLLHLAATKALHVSLLPSDSRYRAVAIIKSLGDG